MTIPQPVAGWCPPGGCPARLADQLDQAVALAFQLGREYERAELARQYAAWDGQPWRHTYEQWVAAQIADMEAAAQRVALDLLDRHGRPPWTYTGGPVDWHTGRPLTSTIGAVA